MRKRNHSTVDTFPFLAVLLCAMGALILVLLVMDRRSKLAAQARGLQQAQKQAAEHARTVAARKREHDSKRKAAQTAWEKKRDDLRSRVTAEKEKLDAELQQVQRRLAEAARRLRDEQDSAEKLRDQVKEEQARLVNQERALKEAREEAASLSAKLSAADSAKATLAADLKQLEQTLRDLQASRQRDAQTYSVIPYHGKRGDNRRPIYVECASSGLIFHPEKAEVDAVTPSTIRTEVEKRIAAQKEQLAATGAAPGRAYLMLLVRPDGAARFYQVKAAVSELPVDFGYELVDAEWKFHFPSDDALAARPDRPAVEPQKAPTANLLPPSPHGGSAPWAGNPGSVPGNNLGGAGVPGTVEIRPPLPANPPAGIGQTTTPGGSRAGAPWASPPNSDGLLPIITPPVVSGTIPQPSQPTSPSGRPGGSGPGAPAHPDAPLPIVTPPVVSGTNPRPATNSLVPPAVASGVSATSPSSPPASGSPGGGGQDGPRLSSAEPRREVPMRPARISGNDEFTVYIECQADVVIVHPTRKRIDADALQHTAEYNPLHKAVRQLIQRQREMARPGEPAPRVLIQFLVHGDGERTYHKAYPPLETVSAPKTRRTLQPGDDVAHIVAGY